MSENQKELKQNDQNNNEEKKTLSSSSPQQNFNKEHDEPMTEQKLEELLLQGRVLFNEFKLEEAQNKFQEALVKGIKFYNNEIAEQLAKFYYSYGNTLLAKQSEFLGEKVKKITNDKEQQKQVVDGVTIQEENSKQQEDPVKAKDQINQQNNNIEDDDDIEIAWDNLEVARTLTEKQLDSWKQKNENEEMKIEILKNLSRIKLRQGDLQAINDNFDFAILEYNECLKLRMQFENNETSRELAEMQIQQQLLYYSYFLIGNTNLYKNEKNSEEIALQYFSKATNFLQNLLEKELNAQGQLFTQNDKELKQKIINREPLKDSFLDNETSKELKAILNMMYDKIEDTLAQLNEKEQFEKEKQLALFTSQGFSTQKIEDKKVINLGVIKGTGGQKKVVIPTPVIEQEQQSEKQQKDEIVQSAEDGFPVKKLKLE